MTDQIVIGLVGEPGSGKGTAAKILGELLGEENLQKCSSGDVCRETLNLWGIPLTRENQSKIALMMMRVFGEDSLAKATGGRIATQSARIVLFDGVRMEPDRNLVRNFPNNRLIYVTASPQTRFERAKARGEKVGEASMTLDQFIAEGRAGTEAQIAKIGATADQKIENEGSVEDLRSALKEFCDRSVKLFL